jgi:hypothetical protein
MKEPLLAVGDNIRVHGWVMMQNISPGDYRVAAVSACFGIPTYSLVRKGGRIRHNHVRSCVEAWLRPNNQTNDLNWIERL